MSESSEYFWISGNTPSSKNNRVWTGSYFIASKATTRWRRDTKKEWLSQRQEFIESLVGLPKPYYIELTFVRRTKHRFDYINIAQGVMDEMVEHGWLQDDDAENAKPYFGDFEYNKDNPGVKIRVLKRKPIHYDSETYRSTS